MVEQAATIATLRAQYAAQLNLTIEAKGEIDTLRAENERLQKSFVRQRDCDHSPCIDEADALRAALTIADTTAANLHDEIRKRDEAIATLRAAMDGLVEPLGEWLIEMMERNLTPAEATLYDALRAALATTKEAGGG